MPRIEFPNGFEGVENLPKTNRSLKNCFNNGNGHIISRPGIDEISDSGSVARGQFEWNGSLYQVQSTSLEKITNVKTGASTTIGTIAGTDEIRVAIGFNTATIIVQNATGALYTLDTSDTLTDISSNSNIVPCIDIAHINGRFVYIPFDGSVAFFSDVGAAGTVDALSFFDAEELPDKNNAVFNGKNTLYIGGTDSIELYRDTGESPVPFIRINGARILNGFIGGLLEYNNTFLFIGREKDQDRGIYSIVQGGAAKISNARIDLILSTYTDTELAATVSGRFKWRGDDIATFTLGSDSFGFFGGHWFILDSLVNETLKPWVAGFITEFEGTYYTAFGSKFGKLEKINTDNSNYIVRLVETAFEKEEHDNFTCQSIELVMSQGFNDAAASVGLFMTRDNVLYGPGLFRETGDVGEYEKRTLWNPPGGLGNYAGFMGIRFYTTADIDFSLDRAIVKFR